MLSEQECTKILNVGEIKYDKDEVKLIRDLIVSLATIEYEEFNKKNNTNN
jgi:hypothetical protein